MKSAKFFAASVLALCVCVVTSAAGQSHSGRTEAPATNAADRDWYAAREPLPFAGDTYYPAGAAVFFNGNSMVQTASFDGVPLYVDTTIEPYSIVYLPIGRGLMQPYERPRRGELAGTTGSRAPSFPVATASTAAARSAGTVAAMPPVSVPLATVGLTGTEVPGVGRDIVGSGGDVAATDTPTATAGTSVDATSGRVATLLTPENNDGVWVRFAGQKWVHGGGAVPLTTDGFVRVGDYAGFPVYTRATLDEDAIYLPTRGGLIVPYRLKE